MWFDVPPNGIGARPDQAGQQPAEPGVVLGGEPPCDQVLVGVVVGQPALQAGHVRPALAERHDCPPQLQRLGMVFRVEDGDELAGGHHQPVVARLRLRAWLAGRDQHDLHRGSRARDPGRGDRLGIVLLEQQQHLEPIGRVLERGHAGHHRRHHLGLPVGGHQHRVHRQLVIRQRARYLVRHVDRGVVAQRGAHQPHPVREGRRVGHDHDGDEHERGGQRLQDRDPGDPRGDDGGNHLAAGAASAASGGQFGGGVGERVCGQRGVLQLHRGGSVGPQRVAR